MSQMNLMQTLRKSEIPAYLKAGELYRTLTENNDDPEEEITFPAKTLKMNQSVNSSEECDCLLNSLRFWGVDKFWGIELIRFVMSHPTAETIAILKKYEGWVWTAYTCAEAASGGQLHCLQYLHEQGCPWNQSTRRGAVDWNQPRCVQYLDEHGCP